jgi:hypothetical protein
MAMHGATLAQRKRYLAYDGGLISTNNIYMFHDLRACQAVLLHMITVALLTNRILVLPSVFDAQRHVGGAQFIDLKSLEALGVEWRESTFLHNRKITFGPDASVSHAVIGPGLLTMRSQKDGGASGGGGTGGAGGAGHVVATKLPPLERPLEMWPAVWRELTADDSDVC